MLHQNILKIPCKLQQIMCGFVRGVHHNKKHVYKNQGEKFEKLRYYPRPDSIEVPIENPVKLFKVQRIKTLKGNPYWEKKILQLLGLSQKMSDVAIIKNIPEMNAMLMKVKHLIDVKPIVFPYGQPSMNDINHTFLKENGECVVTKEINIDENRLVAREEFDKKSQRLDGETLARNSRLKWLNGFEC